MVVRGLSVIKFNILQLKLNFAIFLILNIADIKIIIDKWREPSFPCHPASS